MTHNRQPCSLGQEKCQPRTLVEEIFCVARHSDIPARDLAARIGISYANYIKRTEDTLSRAAAPAWLMLALAVHTGRTEHIERLARDAGLVAYRVPRHGVGTAHMATTVKEFGELLSVFAERSADGEISEADYAVLEREGQEAMSAIAAWLDALKPASLRTPRLVGGAR